MALAASPSPEEAETLNRRHMLNALSFDGMNERFYDIRDPYAGTFEWALEKESKEALGSPYQAASVLLREWLSSGEGVFHISGKIGSGKSTFIKHLYEDKRTKEFLREWATGRKLVLSKFFFWKYGRQLQKSLEGLLRTLLYDALQQFPELIPVVFPQQWDSQSSPWERLGRSFSLAELQTAFQSMIQNRYMQENWCFCLFIDELDGFDGSHEHDYRDLANFLLRATKSESVSVKICVSSRQLPVFMERFSMTQRLTMHYLTQGDIEMIVRETFESGGADLMSEKVIHEIVQEVVMKAEGSFLWVQLAMKSVLEGLELGDSDNVIRHKLDRLPNEMQHIYEHIFMSFDPANSDLFLVALSVISSLSRASETAQLHPHYGMSLLAFSFLEDLIKDPNFALKLDFSHPMIGDGQLPSRLVRLERTIGGRFGGLLETKPRHQSTQGDSWPKTALQYDVVVTHHTINHTMESIRSRGFRVTELRSLSAVGVICQTTIAMVKSLNSSRATAQEDRSPGYVLFFDREFLSLFLLLRANRGEIEAHLKSLDCLENELHQLRCSDCTAPTRIDPQALGQKTTLEYLPYFGCVHFDYAGLSLHHAAASFGLHEYAIRLLDRSCIWEIAALMDIAVDTIENSRDQELLRDGVELLKAMLSRGISADTTSIVKIPLRVGGSGGSSRTTTGSHEISLSVWQRVLFNLRFLNRHGFEAVEALLESGASPKFSISTEQDDTAHKCIENSDGDIVFPSPESENLVTSYLLVTLPSSKSSNGLEINLSSRRRLPESLLAFIRRNGGSASLADIIKLTQPHNEEHLLYLIDHSAKNKKEPIPTVAKTHSSMAWVELAMKNPIAPFVLGLLVMYLFTLFMSR